MSALTDLLDVRLAEVEQARPGTNFTKIPPKNVAKLKGIIEHYRGKAHGFTACVRDQLKHGLSEDHANRRCAVVKDLGKGTTKWRKGGKVAERIVAAVERVEVIEEELGAGAAARVAFAESGSSLAEAMSEGVFEDLTVLLLAEHELGLAVMEAFEEKLHPRDFHGRFKAKLSGLKVGQTAHAPGGIRATKIIRRGGGEGFHVKGGKRHDRGDRVDHGDETDSAEVAARLATNRSLRSTHPASVGGKTSYRDARHFAVATGERKAQTGVPVKTGRRATEGREGVKVGQVWKVVRADGNGGEWEVIDADPASPHVRLRSKRSGREQTVSAAVVKREFTRR